MTPWATGMATLMVGALAYFGGLAGALGGPANVVSKPPPENADTFGTIFHATSWDYATGSGQGAVRDSSSASPYNDYGGTLLVSATADSAGRGFPQTNFLRVGGTAGVRMYTNYAVYDTFRIGEKRGFRFYFKPGIDAADDKHPMYFDDNFTGGCGQNWGPCLFGLDTPTGSASNWDVSMGADVGGNGKPRYWDMIDATMGGADSTYLIEGLMERIDTLEYTLQMRLSYASGVRILNPDEFTATAGWGFDTSLRMDTTTFTVNSAVRLDLGMSGVRWDCVESCPANMYEVSGYAIGTGGWMPAWTDGEWN